MNSTVKRMTTNMGMPGKILCKINVYLCFRVKMYSLVQVPARLTLPLPFLHRQ
jgi:hypothetical protein